MKKRIISLILCAAVIISACGCSADNGTLSADSSSSASAVSSAEAASQDTSLDSGSSYDTSSDASDKTSSDKQNSSSSDSSDKQNNSSDASFETSKPSTNKQETGSSAVTSSKPANNTGSATNKPASATAADTTKKPSATTTTTTLKQTDDKPLNFSKTYEAENGKLSNDMSVISGGNASGGKTVGKFENDRSYCQISITVPADAVYDIVIRSKGIGGSKENDIYTDGKKVGTFTSENNKFSDYTVSAVSLTKGDHNIRIIKSWGWIELDKITVKTGAK